MQYNNKNKYRLTWIWFYWLNVIFLFRFNVCLLMLILFCVSMIICIQLIWYSDIVFVSVAVICCGVWWVLFCFWMLIRLFDSFLFSLFFLFNDNCLFHFDDYLCTVMMFGFCFRLCGGYLLRSAVSFSFHVDELFYFVFSPSFHQC